jgi:hypothetical protein
MSRGTARLRAGDGAFEFNHLQPGRYAISYTAMTNGTANLRGTANVTVTDRDVENVLLELGPGADITGKIHIPGAEQPRPQQTGARQQQQGQPSQGNQQGPSTQWGPRGAISLGPVDPVPMASSNSRVEEDGTFLLKGVVAGRYQVRVIGLSAGMYVKSLRYAGQEQNGMILDVASGSPGTLDINVAADAADVSGRVQDANGTAIPRAIVTLWQPGDQPSAAPRYFALSQSDQGGSFRIQSVPPGDYQILAWEQIDSSFLGSPELFNLFSGSATPVKLEPSGHSNVDLKAVTKEDSDKETAKFR